MTDTVAAKPEAKTFFCSYPGATFYAQRTDKEGKRLGGQIITLQFSHFGALTTSDPDAIQQLEETAALPNSPIYIDAEKAEKLRKAEMAPFEEVKSRAGDIVEQIAKAGQRA